MSQTSCASCLNCSRWACPGRHARALLQLSWRQAIAQGKKPGDDTLHVMLRIQAIARLCLAAGKLLERRLIYAPGKQDALVTDRDLFVGARLPIAQRVFELTEADAFTMQCAPAPRSLLPVRSEALCLA